MSDLWLIVFVVSVFLAAAIGSSKGKGGTGLLLGFLLGPLGVIITLLLKRDEPDPVCRLRESRPDLDVIDTPTNVRKLDQ